MRQQDPVTHIVNARIKGSTYNQIGAMLGWSKDRTQKLGKRAFAKLPPLPALPKTEKFPPEITIKGDIVITSDLHCNAIQTHIVENVSRVGLMLGVKQIAIVGDLFNFDAFSLYPELVAAAALDDEITGAKTVLKYWLESFEHIYLCTGNHDRRASVATKRQLNMSVIKKLLVDDADADRLTVTELDRLWLKESSGKWLLCHQHDYSQQTLTVANVLAQKYQCHVVTAHQHHCGVGVDKFGRYVIADNPSMADDTRIAYKHMLTNKLPNWAFGFSAIVEGQYQPFPNGKPIGI